MELRPVCSPDREQIRQASLKLLAAWTKPRFVAVYGRWQASEGTAHTPDAWFRILAQALQQEARSIDEMVDMAGFALSSLGVTLDRGADEAMQDEWASVVLRQCSLDLTAAALLTPMTANSFFKELRHHFRDMAEIRGKRVMFPIHAALAGSLRGPCLGIVASLLGLERCQERLQRWWSC